jgi:rfaE bifunctional protein nucleotidyltransferase chain/domain
MAEATDRIYSLEELVTLRMAWKENGETVIFTNGCFDILHVGHLQTLSRAKAEGTKLVVGVNSDSSVKRLKGPTRPLNSESDRALLLAGLRCVDAVVIFSEDTPIPVLERLRPDVHVKGGDYQIEDLPEAEIVLRHGGRIVIIDLVPGRSTTGLIEKTRTLDPKETQA